MPRLFVALEIPPDIALSLSLLRGGLHGARWIDVEKYHLTLRFIGDVDARTADELLYALDRVEAPKFDLMLEGMGAFGSKKPRSIWAGTNQPKELFELQSNIERQCQKVGLPPESRRFTPHITLARLKWANQFDVGDYLGARGNFRTLPFIVENFVVMSSRNAVGGGPYVIEETYPLREAYSDCNFASNDVQPSSSIL